MGNNRFRLCVLLGVNVALLCCCARQPVGKSIEPIAKSQKEQQERDPFIAELKRLYEAAQLPYERRAVAFRAIDEGTIQRGRPVSSIDAIFGTNFVSDLPLGKDSKQEGMVYFGPKFSPAPTADGRIVAGGHIGWAMTVEYDHDGQILSYNLSNIWKGHSSYEESKTPTPVAELRRLYEISHSEEERRAVCLRAIDEGFITTFRQVTRIDEIFGTYIASDLPTKKEGRRVVTVDFASQPAVPGRNQRGARSTSWFLSVDYDDHGEIRNYSLSNFWK